MTFDKHVELVIKKIREKSKKIFNLRGTDWGWHPKELTIIFKALIETVTYYLAAAWMPWTSQTNL